MVYFEPKTKYEIYGCMMISSMEEVAWQENMGVHHRANDALSLWFDSRWKSKHTLYAAEQCHPLPCPHNYQGVIWQQVCLVNNNPEHLKTELLGE